MKVIVCGGRDYRLYGELRIILDHLHAERGFTLLAHGDAAGADTLAGKWAKATGVQQVRFPANWEGQGNAAGHIRNTLMLTTIRPDFVIAFPGGRGTANMMTTAGRAGIEVVATEDLVL